MIEADHDSTIETIEIDVTDLDLTPLTEISIKKIDMITAVGQEHALLHHLKAATAVDKKVIWQSNAHTKPTRREN